MQQDWSSEDLIASWTLVEDDWQLLGNKSGATRLGFALLLKFFEVEGRFPAYAEEFPPGAVRYVAELVGVEASLSVSTGGLGGLSSTTVCRSGRRWGSVKPPGLMSSR